MNIIKYFTLISIKDAKFFLAVPITGESVGDSSLWLLDQTYKAMALSLKLILNLTMAIAEWGWTWFLCNSTIVNRIKQWKRYA